MGSLCSFYKEHEGDVYINKEREKENENEKQNMIIQNMNLKDDILVETKVPEKADKKYEQNKSPKIDIIKEDIDYLTKNQYNQRVFDLINKIRSNPPGYAQTVLDNINYISKETIQVVNENTGKEENKEIILFKKKVKVNLYRGEECFREVVDVLKYTSPLKRLAFNNNIVIPLPENEEEMFNSNHLKEKANEIKLNYNVNIYFKEYIRNPEIAVLMMIVDDTEDMEGKKRDCLLNTNLKYIGINSKFINNNFIAYFSFSK